jgi:hypothetical protein
VLLDALAGAAMLGLCALGAAGLLQLGAAASRRAEQLDTARRAAIVVLEELETVSFHRLPTFFGAGAADHHATLDTARGEGPPRWGALVAPLPEGALRVELEGLGPGGTPAPFDEALALRVRVRVRYGTRGASSRLLVSTART